MPQERLGARGTAVKGPDEIFCIYGGVQVKGKEWNPSEWFGDTWILMKGKQD